MAQVLKPNDLAELKQVVVQKLESDGFILDLKAQLRKYILSVCEGHGTPASEGVRNPLIRKSFQSDSDQLLLTLVYDVLHCLKLNATRKTFEAETSFRSDSYSRRKLEDELGADEASAGQPILLELLQTRWSIKAAPSGAKNGPQPQFTTSITSGVLAHERTLVTKSSQETATRSESTSGPYGRLEADSSDDSDKFQTLSKGLEVTSRPQKAETQTTVTKYNTAHGEPLDDEDGLVNALMSDAKTKEAKPAQHALVAAVSPPTALPPLSMGPLQAGLTQPGYGATAKTHQQSYPPESPPVSEHAHYSDEEEDDISDDDDNDAYSLTSAESGHVEVLGASPGHASVGKSPLSSPGRASSVGSINAYSEHNSEAYTPGTPLTGQTMTNTSQSVGPVPSALPNMAIGSMVSNPLALDSPVDSFEPPTWTRLNATDITPRPMPTWPDKSDSHSTAAQDVKKKGEGGARGLVSYVDGDDSEVEEDIREEEDLLDDREPVVPTSKPQKREDHNTDEDEPWNVPSKFLPTSGLPTLGGASAGAQLPALGAMPSVTAKRQQLTTHEPSPASTALREEFDISHLLGDGLSSDEDSVEAGVSDVPMPSTTVTRVIEPKRSNVTRPTKDTSVFDDGDDNF